MPSAALVLDHERDLLVPDKATLCALSHQSPGSYEAFGLLILPKGAVQSFDDAPGHYLVAGTNEDVKRQILPAKVEFVEAFGRKGGVAFRVKQSVKGTVYIGCVDSAQIKQDSTTYANLEDDIDWVVAANVQSFEELRNGDGFPLLNHVSACLKGDSFMKALKVTDIQKISRWCQPGKFGLNLRTAWAMSEVAMRKGSAIGKSQTPGEIAALEKAVAELKTFYEATEELVPYYDLPLHKRIVTIDPQPAADINDGTISKLKALLE